MKHPIRRHRPQIEALEARWNPALLLQLDSAGNLFGLFGTPTGDLDITLSASGLNITDGGVNLGTYGVAGNLNVTLGNSTIASAVNVNLGGLEFPGSISFRGGNGLMPTTFNVNNGTIAGNLSVQHGAGDDVFNLGNTATATVQGSLSVDLGAGNDSAMIGRNSVVGGNARFTNVNNVTFGSGRVGGSFVADASREGGSSHLSLFGSSRVAGSVTVLTSLGTGSQVDVNGTVGGNTLVRLAGGDDTCFVGGDLLGNLTILGSNGSDELDLDVTLGGNLIINLGTGDDFIGFGGETSATVLGNSILVNLGTGDDLVDVNRLFADGARMTVLFGNGDDVFVIEDTANLRLASLYADGGFGSDILDQQAGVFTYPTTLRNF